MIRQVVNKPTVYVNYLNTQVIPSGQAQVQVKSLSRVPGF